MSIEQIENNGSLLYKYLRGSHMYGLNNQDSDEDYGGIFICRPRDMLGLGINYQEQVSDAKSDIVYWELKRFIQLACKGNPSVVESLFVPKRCVMFEHPIITELKEHRNKFLTKHTFNAITGYAVQQIQKARGLNKKIVNPVTVRKTPLDFCYVPQGMGSMPLVEWLEIDGLKPEFCGLVKIPHMNDMYNVFYDWGAHIENLGWDYDRWKQNLRGLDDGPEIEWPEEARDYPNHWWSRHHQSRNYKGIVHDNSNQLLLSSIVKYDVPIVQMSYNQTGYTKHCIDYKNYKDWEKYRNPKRYESNLDKNYDSKNMMHCFRLIHMCTELAETGQLNVDRSAIDRDFLMDIRNHKYEYDQLIGFLDQDKKEMEEAINNSNLPKNIDTEFFDEWLIKARLGLCIDKLLG